MSLSIREVRTKADLSHWIEFPRRKVYGAESPWVPPLDSDLLRMLARKKNPFFRHGDVAPYLVVDRTGEILGRVLAHIYHRSNVVHKEKASFFGYFECLDNKEAAIALIDACRKFGERQGCELLRGPFNMTAMQEMGILIEGFENPPASDETYTAAYYPSLLEAAGLKQIYPVTTFKIEHVQTMDIDALLKERHHKLLADGKVKVRLVNLSEYDREIETLRELLNNSFYYNPHFVPITNEEFEFQVGPYKQFMDPSIILIAESYGVPCGFVMAVPNFNPLLKKLNGKIHVVKLMELMKKGIHKEEAAIIIMGVQRELQGEGIMRILLCELLKAVRRSKYKSLHITWIADVNDKSLASARGAGGKQYHRLCLYEGAINGKEGA